MRSNPSCLFSPRSAKLRKLGGETQAEQYRMAGSFASRPIEGVMPFAAIDLWIGKTFFIPLIIKLCQITRQTQFAMSRLFWFAATCDGLYRAETLIQSLIFGVLCVVALLTAAFRADFPARSMMPFRLLSLGLFAFDLMGALSKGDWAGIEFWVFVLFAEYAATIRTIPPGPTPKRRHSAKTVRQSGQGGSPFLRLARSNSALFEARA